MATNEQGQKLKAIDKINIILDGFGIPDKNPKNPYAKDTRQQFMMLSNFIIDALYEQALQLVDDKENENNAEAEDLEEMEL